MQRSLLHTAYAYFEKWNAFKGISLNRDISLFISLQNYQLCISFNQRQSQQTHSKTKQHF